MFLALDDIQGTMRHLQVPHKGIVVDNLDPLKLKRVKCTITDLFDATDQTALPWVYQLNTSSGSTNSESCDVPEIGSELEISFPYNDIYMPFYHGSWASKTTKTTEFDADYPYVYGTKDSKGNSFKTNKLTGDVTYTHSKGTTLFIDGATGNVTIGNNSATKEYIVMEAKMIAKFNAHTHPNSSFIGTIDVGLGTCEITAGSTDTPNTSLVAGDIASLKHRVGG